MNTPAMCLCFVLLGAGDAGADERLPGSQVRMKEAVGRAQIIVVAKVECLGVLQPGPSGSGRYSGLKLKPSKSLKGGTGTRELTLEDFKFRTFPEEVAEAMLEERAEYLFFIEKPNAEQLWGFKALRATEENVAAVTDAQRREVRWPGSERHILSASRDAQLVVVAKVIDLGRNRMGPPSSTSYGPSKIEVVNTLKGMPKDGLSPTFEVMTVPPERAEHVPVPGDEYVMFIELREGVAPHVLRMMPVTKENIKATVMALEWPQAPGPAT